MLYEEINKKVSLLKKITTKDIDSIAKDLIKNKVDVSELLPYIKENGIMYRIYIVVSLTYIKNIDEQLSFIEKHFEYLSSWWSVDILLQLLVKPLDFDKVFILAKEYVKSPYLYVRRWGYVIFLCGFQKDPSKTKKILSLFKNDDEYYVQMAEAWLLADMCIYNVSEVTNYIKSKTLNYDIIGKAIQKIQDSYRIEDTDKKTIKELRGLY